MDTLWIFCEQDLTGLAFSFVEWSWVFQDGQSVLKIATYTFCTFATDYWVTA